MYNFTTIIKTLNSVKNFFEKEGEEYYRASIASLDAYISFLEAVHGDDFMDERDPDYPTLIIVLEEIEEFILVSKEILGENIERY